MSIIPYIAGSGVGGTPLPEPTRTPRVQLASVNPQATVDNGTYLCGAATCEMGGPGPSVTALVTDALHLLDPAPDEFCLYAILSYQWDDYHVGCQPGPACGPFADAPGTVDATCDAPCRILFDGNPLARSAVSPYAPLPLSAPFLSNAGNGPDHASGELFGELNFGWVAHPSMAMNDPALLIWHPGEINSFTLTLNGQVHTGQVQVTLNVYDTDLVA